MKSGAILGLDISLVATGIVVLPPAWKLGDWGKAFHRTVGYSIIGAEEEELLDRIDSISTAVAEIAREMKVAHAFREAYAWGRTFRAQMIGEVTGVVRLALFKRTGLTTCPISSTTWRKLLIGVGKAPKGRPKGWIKMESIRRLHVLGGMPKDWTSDEADAVGVVNAGLAELGLPFMTLLE